MKEKIFVLFALLFVLVGCGSKAQPDATGKEAENPSQVLAPAEEKGSSDADSKGQKDPMDQKHMSLVLDWYPNALHAFLYMAMDKGYFADEGLQLDLHFPSNANDAMSLVAAGKADIGLYYQQDVIQARAEQAVPIKSIGAVVQGPLNIVLSLQEKKIHSPQDLVGKTVGYAGTELSEALIRSMVQKVGADYSQVKMVDVGFDLMSSMTTGNVDATIGCLKNHEVPQMEEEGFAIDWFELTDYGIPSYYEAVFLANDQTIAEDSESLRAFLRAAAKGFSDCQKDPEGALKSLLAHQSKENFPLSETVERKSLEVLLPMMETDQAKFLSQSDQVWQDNIDWMLKEKLIDQAPSLDEVRVNLLDP